MTTLTQITVPFHNAELYIVEHEGQPFIPMRSIVQGIGLDWKSQFVKLKQRFATCVVEITMQILGDDQARSHTCLLLRKLPAWLYSIHANKVKPELRDTVIMYQNECDDVLWDYWTKGQAINQRHTITPEQQHELHEIVSTKTGTNVSARMEMWTRHNRHFKISKYHQLLAVHFEDAKNYLETMVLKTKAEKPAVPQISIEAYEDKDVQYIMWYAPMLARLIFDDIVPALRALDSHKVGSLFSYTQEMIMHVNGLNRRAKEKGIISLAHVEDRLIR